ncbi:hypothetical protein EVG20_g9253 [Dentipellis fragilis]|uniref:Uncharacterized protein n=1 Tax=Dentipellis fragilis TaxID=205917 RepID=A0A4Y9Y4D1_9AGAM|nr:hypothetical protein EVG20_g9253 [Dentipellis fragilis]
MSYHPYSAAYGQQNTLSANHTAASSSQTNTNSLSGSSNAVQSSDAVNYDNVVLPSRAQLDQEMYEAKLARDQGRISPTQYCEVLARCMHAREARLDRAMQGLRRAKQGENTRELINRNFDLTDSEVGESREQARRRIELKLENLRRHEQGICRRRVTRGF